MAEHNPMMTLQAELARFRKATLNSAVRDADKLLDLLVQAREQIANGMSFAPAMVMLAMCSPVSRNHSIRSAPRELDHDQAPESRQRRLRGN